MAILHAFWEKKSFYIWVETPISNKIQSINFSSTSNYPKHPYCNTNSFLKDFSKKEITNAFFSNLNTKKVEIHLPTNNNLPIMSTKNTLNDSESEQIKFQPWLIDILQLSPTAFLDFLKIIHSKKDINITFGEDFKFWTEIIIFILKLLLKELYYPILQKSKQNEDITVFQAKWKADLSDEILGKIIELTKNAPRIAFRQNLELDTNKNSQIQFFINYIINDFLRTKLSVFLPQIHSSDSLNFERFQKKCIDSLFSQQQKSINLSTKEYTFLAGKLKAFLEKYQKNRKKHLQLSFHISPPPIKNNSSQRDWFVEFNLIDPVDPSVIIPSATLWHGSIELLELLQEKYEHPQIAFLEQLQQASHLWPALKNVLAQQFPQKIKISLEDISPFIENIAPKLNEHGFDVKIPSWWSDSPTKIRLRLLPDELAQDGELKKGYFSMNTIISFNWIISVNNQPMSMERFKQLAQLKVPFANHRGKWVKLDPQTMEKALQCVQEFYESMTLQEFLQEFMLKDHSAYSFDIQIDDQKQLLQPLSQFIEKEKIDTTEEVPELFQGSLRSYQKLGYAWLLFLSRIGFGACLADDMGLGKTIQTIAFLCRRIEKSTDQNTSLIISPTSILTNWFKEFEKFAPDLKILIHHGYDRFTEEVFNNEISNYDVVITTYSLAVLDFDLLNQINWDVLILDEAQNIKNPKTQQARHIKKFSSNFRIALTGTPIENRLSELWSIMDFLNPSYLGSLNHFKRKFVQKIENNPSGLHSKQLSKLIQPFILRRKKTDSAVISDLPKKIEQKIFCPLTEEQAMLYESVVQDLMQKLQFAESIHRKGFVFSAITKLKQICNHPSQYLKNKPTRNFERKSGKIIRLFEMLEEIIDNDEKALIFTQYKELGDLLQKQLQEHFNQEILFLNGSTPRKKRVELVNRFQNDSIENSPNLFILSLKAGGLGLNLTEATHVFHYDRWWNPAVENQATDRAYRIGQDKNVFVHKFITIGTLEEKIDQLIEDKKALAEKIVSSQYAWLNDLSTEKLRDLLSYKSVIIGGR